MILVRLFNGLGIVAIYSISPLYPISILITTSIGIKILTNLIFCNSSFLGTVLATKLKSLASPESSKLQYFLFNLFSIFHYFYNILSSNYDYCEELLAAIVELMELFKVFASLSDVTWSVSFVDSFAQFFHSNGTNSFLQMISRIATIEETTTGTAKVYVAVCHLFTSFFKHIDSRNSISKLFDLFQEADYSGKGFVTSHDFYNHLHAHTNGAITRYEYHDNM